MSLPLPYHFIEKQMQRVGFWTDGRTEPFASLAPDAPFWAVGDIHGRRDLLDRMIPRLTRHQAVFVGDMIDRGPDSRAVLHKIHDLCSRNPQKFHVIKGNHEELLLGFLADPETIGPYWTQIGGLQTLASFGISVSTGVHSATAYRVARDALHRAMGQQLIDWLTHLPLIWSSGNVHVVHAGADPARPLQAQDPGCLTWGHSDFARARRLDGQWVVHGHVIVDTPTQTEGRIAIDTGAYATGVLTAAHISTGTVNYVRASKFGP